MTRLTNTIRDAFIKAVMADVPSVDYQAIVNDRVNAAQAARFPLGADAFYQLAKAGWLRSTSGFVATGWVKYFGPDLSPLPDTSDLDASMRQQSAARDDVRRQVRALAYSHTTLEKLREAAPELAKYLPVPSSTKVDRTVPVVQVDVVGVLRAAGWGQ